jgi:hypothetical protein
MTSHVKTTVIHSGPQPLHRFTHRAISHHSSGRLGLLFRPSPLPLQSRFRSFSRCCPGSHIVSLCRLIVCSFQPSFVVGCLLYHVVSDYVDVRHAVLCETQQSGAFGLTILYSVLRWEFEFIGLQLPESIDSRGIFPRGVLLPLSCESLSQLVEQFPFFTHSVLGNLDAEHGVYIQHSASVEVVSNILRDHTCRHECCDKVYVFQALKRFRHHAPFHVTPLHSILSLTNRSRVETTLKEGTG